MSLNIALFPGSFDPFTIGHESVVRRALPLFDKIVIGVGYNSSKKGFFLPEVRRQMIQEAFSDEPKVEVKTYTGLTVNFCHAQNAKFILRGLRTAADFEYERAIGQMNYLMKTEIETIFLLTKSEHSPVSSTIVRDILRHGGDISQFVPANINIQKYTREL